MRRSLHFELELRQDWQLQIPNQEEKQQLVFEQEKHQPMEEEEIDFSDGQHGPLFNNNAKSDVANMKLNR
ncbi:unnamed protein product, partial [Cylindrotheca closterium]